MRRAALSLVLLSSLTFFVGLGVQAINDSDEGYYAEAAREMVDGRDWLTPHFNAEERWDKPILYYWFTAAAFAAQHDPTEFDARALSALCGIGLVLVTWDAARWLTQHDEAAAWMAGAVVATCYGCFTIARAALPDLPLALFVTAAIWASMRALDATERSPAPWAALAGLATGLGFLDKGPLAVVIPAIVLAPIWWRERARRTIALRTSHVAIALILFAISGVPWYVAMYVKHGAAYARSFFLEDNLERFATTQYNEMRSWSYYVPILVGGLVPWAAFLLVLPWRAVSQVVQRHRRLTDAEWRLLIWAIVPFVLFTVSVGKQPRYILPLLPPVAIMVATAIADRIANAHDAAPRRELRVATILTALMFAAVAFLLYRARPLFIAAVPALTWTGIIAVALAASALAAVATIGAWQRLPGVMAISAAVLLLTVEFGALAGRRPEAVEQVAAMIRVNRFGGEPIAVYGMFVRNLIFYTRIPDIEIRDDATASLFLHANRRVFLVAARRDFDRLKSRVDVPIRALGEVTFLNVQGVRLRTLLTPNPAQELTTVVLISNR